MSEPRVVNPMPDFPVICPRCRYKGDRDENGNHRVALFHSETMYINDEFFDEVDEFWHCEHCDWQQDTEIEDYNNTLSEELLEVVSDMYTRLREATSTYQITAATLSGLELPEGDFHWDNIEGGDWHVYCCGEKDCPRQWHKVCYAEEFKREKGVLTITRRSCDEDGNWEFDDEWSASDGTPFEESDMARSWGSGLRDYFAGWAEYWLSCATSLRDPLGDANEGPERMQPERWVKFCTDAVEDNLKYLEVRS